MESAYHIIAQQIHIPDYKRAGVEIISALCRHFPLSYFAVVILAPNLHGEDRCSVKKSHSGFRTGVPRCVGTERLTIGQINKKARVISNRHAATTSLLVLHQAQRDLQTSSAGLHSCGHKSHQFSVDELCFAGLRHIIKILDRSSDFCTHVLPHECMRTADYHKGIVGPCIEE